MVWFLLGDSMKEQWREIENYEDYVISDQGRVFSYKRSIFLKPAKDGGGYLFVILSKNGVCKSHRIHRLVALAFIPNPENKETVNHIDGIKTNNQADNLEWATHSENTQHSFDNGLQKPPCLKGTKNGRAKLLEKEVLEIRRLYSTGDYSYRALAKMFGVDHSLIGYIIRRKLWKHV